MAKSKRPAISPSTRGYNTNLASEFYVMSVLYRLGFDANLTLGNKKAVDILIARDAREPVTIDVKAVAGAVDWLVGNWAGEIPPARPNHFVVLLSYRGQFADVSTLPEVWVLPHAEFLPLVVKAKDPSNVRYVRRSAVRHLLNRASAWHLLAGPE